MNGKDGVIVFILVLFLKTKYFRPTEFFCEADMHVKWRPKGPCTPMWIFLEKQVNVFQYQQPFRAMSRHSCSLNDNRFMLACYCGGTGDRHWVQTSWPWCQHSCPDFLEGSVRLRVEAKTWKRWKGSRDAGVRVSRQSEFALKCIGGIVRATNLLSCTSQL